MKNRMSDLRNHLFETIEQLKDPEKPMDVDRAQAVSNVASTIINSVKVELKYYEMTGEGQGAADFFPSTPSEKPRLMTGKNAHSA
jgi:hypothetical protein